MNRNQRYSSRTSRRSTAEFDVSESDGSSDKESNSDDDNPLSKPSSGFEMWSRGESRLHLPDYNGIVRLSYDILPQLPKNPSTIHFFLIPEITITLLANQISIEPRTILQSRIQ